MLIAKLDAAAEGWRRSEFENIGDHGLHPFIVASCEEGEQTKLELLVDPRKGFTSKLQRLARYESGSDWNDFRVALFTGPHGASAPRGEYERVLMVASGFGIVAQLPYLRQLIRGYNDFTTRTRRIRLVWQLQNIGKCAGRHWWISR